MIYGLYLSANGLLTQGMRADVISNNLANGSTQGFKRDFLALRQRAPEVQSLGGSLNSRTRKELLAIGGAVEADRLHSIHKQGHLEPTGNPYDVALHGPGFFKVTDMQNTYYTRDGAFTKDIEGFFVLQNGFRLLSDDGEPIQIEEGGEIMIDQQGRLLVNNEPLAQIGVFNPSKLNALHKIGENMYQSLEPVQDEFSAETRFVAGHLEASSVSSVREMTALIEAHRAYEANARMISVQDETLGKAISQIAT